MGSLTVQGTLSSEHFQIENMLEMGSTCWKYGKEDFYLRREVALYYF